MRFPLVKGKKNFYPKGAKCAWCRKGKVCEPNSFLNFSAGGDYVDRKTGNSIRNPKNLDGLMSIRWHGAHWGGTGVDQEIDETIWIADRVIGGQFDIYFCSTDCFRKFLNHVVDKLEDKISKERDKQNRKK